MFSPFGKQCRLAGILLGDEPQPASRSEELLSEHWAKTFEDPHANFCQASAQQFLTEHGTPLDWSSASPPDIGAFAMAAACAAHSAPGPDGLPYAAWKAVGLIAARTLFDASCDLSSGRPARENFNRGSVVFPPKNPTSQEFALGAHRAPKDTRPLSLKCSDNKIIASTLNGAIKTTIAAQLHAAQRGFLRGRQPAVNILLLDAIARCFSFPRAGGCPMLLFFDIAAAFPSLSHKFLFVMLQYIGCPAGLVAALRSFYTGVTGISMAGTFLFKILSGVLQGCPLSGSLFALSFDCFI